MKRILINATHNEEIRVALCKDNHLYDFDLENRTREQKKANIYKGHVTRVEPSLEAVFVEYGSTRQGFLPLREIAPEYLRGNPRNDNIRELIKEGDEVIIQIEKEERGNKGAAVSTYISLAGRYLVLMPNNQKAGGISRQISGKVREEMKQIIASLSIPQGMSIIVRTAGIGKGFDDLQNDLNHLLDIWSSILEQNRTRPSPCLVHQEAGVVTRAVRDYLRDDIGEIWIDSENAYNEAANFIASVMPNQMGKLRKYTDYEPLFVRFGIERQIESAYQREVRLPSGGSIVIDQTEALVSIDINSAKSTKGSDVAETAYHTNLEAADEIARQLRLRDMGGLIVIDFIDMADPNHQKEVEKRLIDATRHDRARVQFAEISKFGLMEMSRQRLRPSLEEATGYLCPRCHGNGMIRDLRSLALSIMRQIEQIALQERVGEIQVEVPIEVSAFLLNEKRESLVYLEQDSGVRVTILPHAHLESPNFSLHFNPDGFAPSSYERVVDAEERESVDRGYEVNWQTKHEDTPQSGSRWQQADSHNKTGTDKPKSKKTNNETPAQPQAVAWLSNLFAPKPQARLAHDFGSNDVASAIEALVNSGASSLGSFGNVAPLADKINDNKPKPKKVQKVEPEKSERHKDDKTEKAQKVEKTQKAKPTEKVDKDDKKYPKREASSQRSARGEIVRGETLEPKAEQPKADKAQKTKPADKDNTEKAKKADTAQKAPRQITNPDEVVVHISTVEEVQIPTRTVHLSLDDSKPKQVAKTNDGINDKSEMAINTQSVADTSTTIATESDTTEPVNKHANETDTQTQDTTKIVENTSVESVMADEMAVNETIIDDLTTSHTVIDDVIANDEQTTTHDHRSHDDKPTNHEQPTQQATPTKVRPALPKLVAPTFDVDYLSRVQALASEQGRAINDPRVIASLATTPVVPTITGTAGEFVRAMLGDTVGDETFVERFVLAMNAFNNDKNTPVATAFDFTNYGFAPLSGEYLDAFAYYVEPLGQFGVPQGKTAVIPSPIGERAINDPRGQYVPVETVVKTSEESATEPPTQNTVGHSGEPAPTPTTDDASEPANNIDSFIDSTLESMDKMFDSAESAIESLVHTLEEIIKPAEKKSKKDKVSSYKDMIENVSGQLLPPTGILSLVAPKKPKTAKPKTPKATKTTNRKITQKAQNAQVVKKTKTTDSIDDNGNDTPKTADE